jgi:hypothetical protein
MIPLDVHPHRRLKEGSVSKVEMTTPRALICEVLFPFTDNAIIYKGL